MLTGEVPRAAGNECLPSAIRLPLLAALATGDPHALDRNAPAGRLLFQALRSAEREMSSSQVADAEDRAIPIDSAETDAIPGLSSGVDTLKAREIYRSAGILDDDISSLVHVYCPRYEMTGPYVLTLRQVEAALALPAINDLFIVENPAVFSTLVDLTENSGLAEKNMLIAPPLISERTGEVGGATSGERENSRTLGPMLLCTSGPASAAALRLIDRYMEQGLISGRLYYSGDFDVKGIGIGNVLASRYEARFTAWHFDRGSYSEGCAHTSQAGVTFSPEEVVRLRRMQAAWDHSLCDTMGSTGRKLFQEQLIVALAGDWNRALGEGRNV